MVGNLRQHLGPHSTLRTGASQGLASVDLAPMKHNLSESVFEGVLVLFSNLYLSVLHTTLHYIAPMKHNLSESHPYSTLPYTATLLHHETQPK